MSLAVPGRRSTPWGHKGQAVLKGVDGEDVRGGEWGGRGSSDLISFRGWVIVVFILLVEGEGWSVKGGLRVGRAGNGGAKDPKRRGVASVKSICRNNTGKEV